LPQALRTGGTPRGPASPYSTGGGGHDFERGVAAYYMAALLSGASPRGVPDGAVLREVRLQTGYAGNLLDDLTVIADLAAGPMTVHMQVKHDIAFTSRDDTFDEVLRDCWATYTTESFNDDLDRMVLVVGVAQTRLSQHYQPLLQTVRTSSDASTFFARVRPGQMAQEQRGFIDLVREKVDSYAGERVPDDTIWRFLRAILPSPWRASATSSPTVRPCGLQISSLTSSATPAWVNMPPVRTAARASRSSCSGTTFGSSRPWSSAPTSRA
jgi:hypothetical protein